MSNIITAGNATNNGTSISSDTSGVLELKTGSTPTTAIAVDASQNVGIGTSSPSSILNVKSASPIFRLETTGTVSSGGVAYNSVRDSTGSDVFINGYAGLANCYQFSTTAAAGFIRFLTGASVEAMRIDSSGNLLVGTTNTTIGSIGVQIIKSGQVQMTRDGATALYIKRGSNSGPVAEFIAENGSSVGNIAVSTSGTSYNTSSDYRLKNTIAPMTGALAKVAALKPVTYKWNADGSDGQGFIAHELQSVVPECVVGEKDAVDSEGKPQYQGIDTSFLVATLTAAIQELKAELDATKAEVAALKGA